MSARSVCNGNCPCRYHSDRAIFGSVQPPGDADLDATRPEPQRRLDRLAHGATERDAFLELHRTDSEISCASSSGFWIPEC